MQYSIVFMMMLTTIKHLVQFQLTCHCKCRKFFPGTDVTNLIEREPLMLKVSLKSVFIFRNPTVVLSMDEHMLGSTIDGDLS